MTMRAAIVGWFDNFPDTPAWCSRYLDDRWKQFAILLLTGLLFRTVTFGDPNLHVDEAFYFLVGQEMHHGAIPYVDIWDRKPFGLFLIYYLIAAISTSVVAYQIVSWLFASCTAMVINLIARRWAGTQGGLLAGVCYIALLGPLEGYGGQTPVFYNLFIACAAMLVFDALPQLQRGIPTWRIFAAMMLGGLAITVKQTALFESGFLGLVVVYYMVRSGVSAVRITLTIVACALLGALPTLTVAAGYWWIGHWDAWWQAMVTSNLRKIKPSPLIMILDAFRMALRLYPFLGLAAVGMLATDRDAMSKRDKRLVGLWIAFGVLGVLSVPYFYTHYALPLLVPLAVASSLMLGRRDVGVFLAAMLLVFSMVLFSPFDRADRRLSIQTMNRMAKAIVHHDDGRGLLVYDGPPYLYALAHKRPLTSLVFPHHMNHWIERNVTGFDTLREVHRVLAMKPNVVVAAAFPSNRPANGDTRRAVMAYVQNNCRIVDVDVSYEIGHSELIAIYGDCRDGAPDMEL
ncbi:MAG TPA: hypothetical protein VGE05_00150 [Novosphingobium sp.]